MTTPTHRSRLVRRPRGRNAVYVGAAAAFAAVLFLAAQLTLLSPPPPPSPAAAFTLALALGSHMVLPRSPERARLWGTAAPGARVLCRATLRGGGEPLAAAARADAAGDWLVALPPQPAGGPHSVTCSTPGWPPQLLEDVLFGDLHLCSGQSASWPSPPPPLPPPPSPRLPPPPPHSPSLARSRAQATW